VAVPVSHAVTTTTGRRGTLNRLWRDRMRRSGRRSIRLYVVDDETRRGIVTIGMTWVVGSFVVWLIAWGKVETCTTDNTCTVEACPAECERPTVVLVVGIGLALLVAMSMGWSRRSARLASLGVVMIFAITAAVVVLT
jgi:hypothetical protein